MWLKAGKCPGPFQLKHTSFNIYCLSLYFLSEESRQKGTEAINRYRLTINYLTVGSLKKEYLWLGDLSASVAIQKWSGLMSNGEKSGETFCWWCCCWTKIVEAVMIRKKNAND